MESITPEANADPEILVRQFFAAMANPSQDFAEARAFLADEASESWAPGGGFQVVRNFEVSTKSAPNPGRRELQIKGRFTGQVDSSGVFTPKDKQYEATIVFEKVSGGQWRITNLPAQRVIEQREVDNQYVATRLFFPRAGAPRLVDERRFIYRNVSNPDEVLLNYLMAGPSERIAPAVGSFRVDKPGDSSLSDSPTVARGGSPLPSEARFAGRDGQVYRFTGFGALTGEQRRLFIAQVVQTLAEGGVAGPYRITLDGESAAEVLGLEPEGGVSGADVADYTVGVVGTGTKPLFALRSDGVLVRIANGTAQSVDGEAGWDGSIETADVSSASTVAVVRPSTRGGSGYELAFGPIDGSLEPVATGEYFFQPSFEPDGQAVWVVNREGNEVLRVAISSRGETHWSLVGMPESLVGGRDGSADSPPELVALSVAPTGARVAMIVDGSVIVGVVTRTESGEIKVVNPIDVTPPAWGESTKALAVAWLHNGSLVVGTNSPDAPVWEVKSDGSDATRLSNRGINSSVVGIEATGSTVYITDGAATRQLEIIPDENDDRGVDTWTEVAGLQGTRALPMSAD